MIVFLFTKSVSTEKI